MCLCEKPRSPQQCLPRSNSHEPEGDIELMVGWDPIWRFAAFKSILAASSPVFEALFQGPLATTDTTITISDVDPRAFDFLLRYLYGEDIKLQNVGTAINTLYAAHKYLVPGLVKICVRYLADSLNVENSIEIYMQARQYSSPSQKPDSPGRTRKHYAPSAPPDDGAGPPEPAGIAEWSAVLLSRCEDHIDAYAEEILRLEAIEDVPQDALRDILTRNTLKCRELTIFATLEKWSDRECRRLHRVASGENRQQVLGDLLYTVRFPLLTANEFMQGPLQSDLLTQEETRYFSALISGSSPAVPPHLLDYITVMRTPREPVRSAMFETNFEEEPRQRGKVWRRLGKDKPAKLHKPVQRKQDKEKRCSGSCIAESMVDVLTWIFD